MTSRPRIHVPERARNEQGKAKPLGRHERAVILGAALYIRKRGKAPTWAELRRAIGCPHAKFTHVMHGLRRKGLIDFENGVPRSLRIHEDAVTQALEKRRPK